MDSINQTQVSLDGLLEILGKNLYSSPSVVLRELIQNAHDACERYLIETCDEKSFQISVAADRGARTLTISDNGSGLTLQEIRDYLATVGSGYTRILRNRTQSKSMIGYFGLGFLSAYVVSTKVEVNTCSYQNPNEAWLFTSAGGKTFSISPGASMPVGTSVKLYLSEDYSSLAELSVLQSLIEKYCSLLPVPIFLGNQSTPINTLPAPWRLPPETSALQLKKKAIEFSSKFENDFEPICCITIPNDNPHNLEGVLWVQDGSSFASSDNRNIHLFIRSMFITDSDLDLIPRWAGFIGGVFESINFNPTASRESLQKDAYYSEVQEYIKEQLIIGLRNIALNEPDTWKRILSRHDQALLGAAIIDPRLFDVCKNALRVPSSLGDMTIPQILSKSDGVIYLKDTNTRGYEETLFQARQIPIVSGYLFGAHQFCRIFSESSRVSLRVLGNQSDEDAIFPKFNLPAQELDELASLLTTDDEELIAADFQPHFIPMIIIEDRQIKLKKKLEEDEAAKRIGSAALSLARLRTRKISNAKLRRVYLNVNNEPIKSLTQQNTGQKKVLATMIRTFCDSINYSSDQDNIDFSETLQSYNDALLKLVRKESK